MIKAAKAREGHCIWYGQCNDDGLHSQNCLYDGPAKILDKNGTKILENYCPHLMNNNGDPKGNVTTCCDRTQLETFDANIQPAANFLARCPSCYRNLVRHLCEFTCSPYQSSFMHINATAKNSNNSKYL